MTREPPHPCRSSSILMARRERDRCRRRRCAPPADAPHFPVVFMRVRCKRRHRRFAKPRIQKPPPPLLCTDGTSATTTISLPRSPGRGRTLAPTSPCPNNPLANAGPVGESTRSDAACDLHHRPPIKDSLGIKSVSSLLQQNRYVRRGHNQQILSVMSYLLLGKQAQQRNMRVSRLVID